MRLKLFKKVLLILNSRVFVINCCMNVVDFSFVAIQGVSKKGELLEIHLTTLNPWVRKNN